MVPMLVARKVFPNLADSDWQWGGEPAQIVETIAGGRMGVMPPHAQLGAETIKDLAAYVRSLSGLPADSLRVAKGQEPSTAPAARVVMARMAKACMPWALPT
jgi:cytochrome c oxidase cbb3-type subunit 3